MRNRKLKIAPSFKKDLKKIDVLVRADAKNKTNILLMNPISTELNIKKLKGFQNKYRVVIIKNHRMIYTFNKEELILVRIKHRKDIY